MTDYTESTPYDPTVLHSVSDSAQAIRTKMYGKDTREAMAQMGEKLVAEMTDTGYNGAETRDARGSFNTLGARENSQDTKIALKADKSYVDAVISSVASGNPKGYYLSLNALQEALPNGDTGVYLVFDSSYSDGAHKFMWKNSSWNDLGAYNAMELADSTVDPIKLTANNHTRYYPFASDSNFSDVSYNNFFKEIKIYNADRTVNYCVAGVFRNNSGKWRIYISILNSDGTVGTSVATWDATNYVEPAGLDLISLTIASNASGRHVDVLVDWNALSATASFGTGSHGNVLKIGSQAYSNNQYVSSYPFSNESVIADNSIQHTILNANLIGADKTQEYCIGSFQKNIGGAFTIIINKYDSGTIGDMVASWHRSNYTPSSTVETIKVEKNSDIADGFDIELEIDWSRMLDGSAFGTNNLQNILIFDKKTYSDVPQDGLLIPSKSMYAVNPQNGFKESAFFAGNWQKRTINDIEVMTSCIPSSGMFFGFHGTELSGKFYKDQAGIQLIVQIDQNDPVAVWIDDNNGITSIATGLSDTDHIAKIFADPYFGTSTDDKHSFFTFKGALNFIEFEKTTWPVWNNAVKTLISYGDSFTAGGGGTIANSYASYCAEYLGLNSIRISQGGAGLVERTDREWIPNLQQIAFQASDGVYTKPQSGDIITINIGTNDTKSVVTDEVYTAAMRDFIAKLKLRHCNAPIFLMGDWVNKYTSDCQTIAEDTEGVYYVDITSWSYPKQDDLHPTDEGHKEIALYLAKAIRDTLK